MAGILAEMSLVELRERLTLRTLQFQEEEAARRLEIAKANQQKKDALEVMEKKHRELRQAAQEVAAVERDDRRSVGKAMALAEKIKLAKGRKEIQQKIESQQEKKAEEALKLANEIKRRQIEMNFVVAGKARAQQKRDDDLARAAKRAAEEYDRKMAETKRLEKEMREFAHKTEVELVKKAAKEQKKQYKLSVQAVEAEAQVAEAFYADQLAVKREQVALIRSYEQEIAQQKRDADPFAARTAARQAMLAQARNKSLTRQFTTDTLNDKSPVLSRPSSSLTPANNEKSNKTSKARSGASSAPRQRDSHPTSTSGSGKSSARREVRMAL